MTMNPHSKQALNVSRPEVALVYDDSAYRETLKRRQQVRPEMPSGLMGREVAGKEFLNAYLKYGCREELIALVRNQANGRSLLQFCQQHPSSRQKARRLKLYQVDRFHETFFPTPPAPVIHFPTPLDPGYAWARQQAGRPGFSLCGVTHTLCSANAVRHLCEMVTAPLESFDTLICTSKAVTEMVRAVTGTYADYLADRHGGRPRLRASLETIPLGVDTEKFQPASEDQRREVRRRLNIGQDQVAVLFVGRLAHHAKVHPVAMYEAAQQAARRSGKKIHFLLAGWAANQTVMDAFMLGARMIAPDVQVSIVDGTRQDLRFGVWKAADIFMSLSDNIQETFGLVIVEAMASGLPVVASDWNGYRDLVLHQETGFLVPTCMVRDATSELTSRLLLGELNYDHFLAESVQTCVVDAASAGEALTRLVEDDQLRRRLGEAGRRRALDVFDWKHIVRAYQQLWQMQDAERSAQADRPELRRRFPGPAIYAELDCSFAGYPTRWLSEGDSVQSTEVDQDRLDVLLRMPLTNMGEHQRVEDEHLIRRLREVASPSATLAELDAVFDEPGFASVGRRQRRATVAWMLKYGLLRPTSLDRGER